MAELSRDKQDEIKARGHDDDQQPGMLSREAVRRKIDALAWHGRCLN